MNADNVVDSGLGNVPPQVLFSNLPNSGISFEVTYSNSSNFTQFNDEVFAAR